MYPQQPSQKNSLSHSQGQARPQRPRPPQAPFNLAKNKVLILGIGFVFLLMMTIIFAFSEEPEEDAGSTGFFLFGGIDPDLLTTCDGDLNSCQNTLETRVAQLATANKTITGNTTKITDLKNENTDLSGQLSTCKSAKETCLSDYNTTAYELIECVVSLSDNDADLNTCQDELSTCDFNLSINISNWLLKKAALETCDAEREDLEDDIETLEADVDYLASLSASLQNQLTACTTSLSARIDDLNKITPLLENIYSQIVDLNVYNIPDTDSRVNLIKTALCDFNSDYC